MAGLDGDQPAEPTTEHEHRPEPQRPTREEQGDAQPADRVAVDRPELVAVGIRRQVAVQQPDHAEGDEHPAVAAVLALAGAHTGVGEDRSASQREGHDRERDQWWVSEERREPAPAEHGKAEIGSGEHKDPYQTQDTHHHPPSMRWSRAASSARAPPPSI